MNLALPCSLRTVLALGLGLFLAPALVQAATAADLVQAAAAQIGVTTGYDPSYRRLAFPGGDVARNTGVCTDVLVRAYRELGIDLQLEVNADLRRAWADYPKLWGLRAPDHNIDHRRVANLQTFFRRHGDSLAVTALAEHYRPGDIVSWRLPSGQPHIGIVSSRRSAGRPLVIHNIGAGVREEDGLFAFTITGHYRYPKTR